MKFTIEEAKQYSNEGKIEEWVQAFLRDEEHEHANANVGSADRLHIEERFYYGPVLFLTRQNNNC